MAKRKVDISGNVDEIETILFGDESDDDNDSLEAEMMYDSENDEEYVADPEELRSDKESSDSEEDSGSQRRQKKVQSGRPKRTRRLPPTPSHATHITQPLVHPTPTADPVLEDHDDPAVAATAAATPAAAPAATPAVAPAATPAAAPAATPAAAPASTPAAAPAATPAAAPAATPAAAPAAIPAAARRRQHRRREVNEDMIVTFQPASVTCRSGYVWHTRPQVSQTTRTPARNIVGPLRPGPTQLAAQATTPRQCFELFVTDDMVNEIVVATNQKIAVSAQKYTKKTSTVQPTTAKEIRALLGVLIFSGYRKDNHLNTKELWCSVAGSPFYRAAMSEGRFCFLLYCLRFDDKNTREERNATDKFAAVRSVWDMFIVACQQHYIPHENLTVDEQLLSFRGNCQFRMYIPNKPAKYGIKIVMINDLKTKYMLQGIPYLGKQGTQPRGGMKLGHMFTKDLTRPYHHTNRNVTTDNWFTSVPLVQDLLHNCGMTLVGTLRANKTEIPEVIKDKASRTPGTSAFLFTKDMTLVSYLPDTPTSKKNVLLLSTMHTQPNVNRESGKPRIIEFYNETKGAVDTFDQMCAQYSCSRKTNRWSLCVFFGIVNAALINSWVIYKANTGMGDDKKMKRRKYMHNLALQLIKESAEERLNIPTQHRSVKSIIRQVCEVNPSGTRVGTGPSAAEMREPMVRCRKCQSKDDKKTRFRCHTCNQPVCPSHYYPLCCDCV